MKNFSDPFKVMKGILQASKILSKEKPDVIFSKGGFTPALQELGKQGEVVLLTLEDIYEKM